MSNIDRIKPLRIACFDDIHSFYWLKTGLIAFCKKNNLQSQGSKSDLVKRIEIFMSPDSNINHSHSPLEKTACKDSVNQITRETLVVNYNNDAEARKFFITQIGGKFKFNAYLRQFTNEDNIKPNLFYDDLVDGWLLFENNKKKNSNVNAIPKQFEYNQFIKDYFTLNKSGTLKKAIKSWRVIKSRSGPNTYAQFKLLFDVGPTI